jgi:uracil-DNA glycosylase family 4
MLCDGCPRKAEGIWSGESGNPKARILIVGMSPGVTELLQGVPFVGASGRVLAAALGEAGINLRECRLVNTINCLPAGGLKKMVVVSGQKVPNGTSISKEQKTACGPRFKAEMEKSGAEVVLLLGGQALEAVGVKGDITEWAGHLIAGGEVPGPIPPRTRWIIPSLHPSYVIRMGGLKLFPILKSHSDRLARALNGKLEVVDGIGSSQPATGWDSGPIAPSTPIAFDIETDREMRIERIGISTPFATGSWGWTPSTQALAKRILEGPGVKIAHNAAFDIPILERHGVMVSWPWWDTMWAAQLLHPDLPKSLTAVSGLVLDTPPWKHLNTKSPEYYNMMDALVTRRLYTPLRDALARDGLLPLFEGSVMVALRTLMEMTKVGIRVDLEKQRDWAGNLKRRFAAAQVELNERAGREININSPKQLQTLLFTDFDLPTQRNAAGGVTTDAGALERLSRRVAGPQLEVIRLLQTLRQTSKLIGTYLQRSPTVHPSYFPVGKDDSHYGAATGRLSSQNPNIQNQPKEARIIFTPHDLANLLVEGDYGSAELWAAAALSHDAKLLGVLESGEDLHAVNSELFGCDRTRAKNLMYGTLYGAGPKKLMETLQAKGISTTMKECKELQERLAATYPDLWAWRLRVVREVEETGFAQNPFGRRRYFVDVHNSKPEIINFFPQSTVADVVLRVVPKIAVSVRAYRGEILTTVHDSILTEVHKSQWEIWAHRMKVIMEEKIPELGISIPASVKIGLRWGRMHEVRV